jgi:hypothetical protein
MKTPEEMAEEYAFKFYLNEDSGYAMTMNRNAFLAGYNAAAPKWISVKNQMPKHDQQVLYRIEIKTKNGIGYKLDYGEYDLERQIFYGEYFDYVDEGWSVTYWMPLPATPKEEV